MSLTTTTLSSAVAAVDNSIVVASATGFAAGNLLRIDEEVLQVGKAYVSGTTIPVLRGQDGTVTAAHKASANVVTFLGSDEVGASPQTYTQWPNVRARRLTSYSAAGAISLPNPGEDVVAVINGTSALAMTLANPTKDMDSSMLIVIANGKAAHTLTYTAGLGNGGSAYDVGTYSATLAGGCILMACNGFWVLIGNGIATATGATGAPLFA